MGPMGACAPSFKLTLALKIWKLLRNHHSPRCPSFDAEIGRRRGSFTGFGHDAVSDLNVTLDEEPAKT
jgi:hypothetical protein